MTFAHLEKSLWTSTEKGNSGREHFALGLASPEVVSAESGGMSLPLAPSLREAKRTQDPSFHSSLALPGCMRSGQVFDPLNFLSLQHYTHS